jgi:hypothetical protein
MRTHHSDRDKLPRDDDDQVICKIDGQLVRDHERCQNCHILIGNGHVEQQSYDQDSRCICGSCVRWLVKRREWYKRRHYAETPDHSNRQ